MVTVASCGMSAAACNPVTSRPEFLPFPEAVEDTVSADLRQTVGALASALQAQGLPVNVASERDGYVETRRFDVRTGRARGADAHHPDRIAVLRFWAEATPRGTTRVQSEAAVRWTADPSLTPRLAEVMADEDHPARQLLDRVLDAIKRRFGDR